MRNIFLVFLIVFFSGTAIGAEIGGIELPNELQVGQQTLSLQGTGLRKKFIISVYGCGLYTLKAMPNAEDIITADEPMLIRMHFIYDGVAAKKLVAAWNEGFAKTAPQADQKLRQAIEQFNSLFTQEALKNDIYDLVYVPGEGVRVVFKGKSLATVGDLAFKKALFGIWLGKDPISDDLKQGLLGK